MNVIKVGNQTIGGGKIAIQSMISKKIDKTEEILCEISQMKEAGLDIIRLAVPTLGDIPHFKKIAENSPVPVVADIHFDYKIAIGAVENGASKIRINPGNIGSEDKIKAVCDACKMAGVPIRVGANLGSLEKSSEMQFGRTAKAIVHSAYENIRILEKHNFHDICVSLKASDVKRTVEANRLFRESYPDYPLHIGVTETGTREMGEVKSAIGIGALLLDGIGETLRVSLTSDPINEVLFAKKILRGCGLEKYVEVISCPTCGRCNYDVEKVSAKVSQMVGGIASEKGYKIAVMGCVVNGIGEGKEADIGIACGDKKFVIFKGGKVLQSIGEDDMDIFYNIIKTELKVEK
ncbi:MAG: flavodoxin-dependent (E)-4-hydroxy-3-methylbut-2-enyl-diphosphate synthase [Bacillota bacterium]